MAGDDIVHVYEISEADYNIYEKDGYHWLTIYVAADRKLEPDDDMNPEPSLELNLYFDKSPEKSLRVGNTLEAPAYDDLMYNLTNMYYWSHSHVEHAKITIEAVAEDELRLHISGDSHNNRLLVLRASFCRNHSRARSFN